MNSFRSRGSRQNHPVLAAIDLQLTSRLDVLLLQIPLTRSKTSNIQSRSATSSAELASPKDKNQSYPRTSDYRPRENEEGIRSVHRASSLKTLQ